ncbi:hypothetical protein [Pseudoalteromonas sp. MMG005]|uniref:hypothetical protein n=1 Tax=Pseudoalteromonas sp. MMG005 TaxID=2822682 RepID=UPI001B3A2E0C|nr:hypothetical protein [Pseudoalteromonas sp. MMG005]MBQ4847620.1 hypothetical protein [Pseudoalteromonas sp. MMG005]
MDVSTLIIIFAIICLVIAYYIGDKAKEDRFLHYLATFIFFSILTVSTLYFNVFGLDVNNSSLEGWTGAATYFNNALSPFLLIATIALLYKTWATSKQELSDTKDILSDQKGITESQLNLQKLQTGLEKEKWLKYKVESRAKNLTQLLQSKIDPLIVGIFIEEIRFKLHDKQDLPHYKMLEDAYNDLVSGKATHAANTLTKAQRGLEIPTPQFQQALVNDIISKTQVVDIVCVPRLTRSKKEKTEDITSFGTFSSIELIKATDAILGRPTPINLDWKSEFPVIIAEAAYMANNGFLTLDKLTNNKHNVRNYNIDVKNSLNDIIALINDTEGLVDDADRLKRELVEYLRLTLGEELYLKIYREFNSEPHIGKVLTR